MATLLVHIHVKPGCEAEFEGIARELHAATHAHDTGCLRYEYWRGAEPGLYYSLLAFEDFHAFLRHQVSEHHEAASPRIGELCDHLKLEWVDPVPGAADLPPTAMMPVGGSADEKIALYAKVFAVAMQDWWKTDQP